MTRLLIIGLVVAITAAVLFYVTNITGRITLAAQATQPSGTGDNADTTKTKALTHPLSDLDGKPVDPDSLKGKVVLVVNVASRCGFTPQYKGLEQLYRKYNEQGLVILGFPCNDFGGQEPGTAEEIKAFCSSKYEVSFPIMEKMTLKGEGRSPVYRDLTEGTGKFAGGVKWNFEKFLIGRDGETLLGRFGSRVAPEDPKLVGAIETALTTK